MNRALAPFLSVALLSIAASGCPKEDKGTGTEPSPAATGAEATASPDATGEATPGETPEAEAGPTTIHYRWGGGLSPYQYYEMTVESPAGADTANVTFKVKPVRDEEKVVEDTLTAEEFAELQSLFRQVEFAKVEAQPRKVRIMDIGETKISRTQGGEQHVVTESSNMQATSDIRPLRKWFDQRVRKYLEQAGVAPGRPKVTASPTPEK